MQPNIEAQFLAAYDEWADAIYRHCFFRVYSKERAEELVQDTFMKTWQYLEKGNEVENLKAFLYKVAKSGGYVLFEIRPVKIAITNKIRGI